MTKYTKKQQEELMKNKYTFKVQTNQISFTKEFKQLFWNKYQAGISPRKAIEELGYDLKYFSQNQIDGLVQHLRKKSLAGEEFSEGHQRERRPKVGPPPIDNPEKSIQYLQHEITYLKQEVEFLKKVLQPETPP